MMPPSLLTDLVDCDRERAGGAGLHRESVRAAKVVVPIEAARSRRDYPPVEMRRAVREHHSLSTRAVAEVIGVDEDAAPESEVGWKR